MADESPTSGDSPGGDARPAGRPLRPWQRLLLIAASPVSPAPVALLRIGVGLVVALESLRLLWPTPARSLLEQSFLAPDVALHHPGFEWVVRLPELPTTLQVAGIGLAGMLLALGLLPRAAAALAAFAWTHLWLAEASLYNNHHYLTSLLLLLLACLPLGAAGSWPRRRRNEDLATPLGSVLALRIQLALMYFYAGVAKLTPEWWTHAEPLRTQLTLPATRARLEALLPVAWVDVASGDAAALALSRSGALLDLFAGFGLLHPKTRGPTALLLVGFHLTNHFVLFDDIGLFPLLGVLSLVVFFPWTRREGPAAPWPAVPSSLDRADWANLAGLSNWSGWASWKLGAVLAFLAVQTLVPLRHFAIPGPVAWTGEGQRFAWRMKAVTRRPGQLILRIEDTEVTGVGSDGRAWLDRRAAPDDLALLREHDSYDFSDPVGSAGESRLPEQYGVWTPRVGLRVIARPGPEGQQDRERFLSRWHAIAGGTATWRPTLGPEETLSRVARGVHDGSPEAHSTPMRVMKRADEAFRAFREARDEASRRRAGAGLRAALARLAADPRVGSATREALRTGPPWLFAGDPGVVGEQTLYLDRHAGPEDFETVRRTLGPDSVFIGSGFDDSAASLQGLPKALALKRIDGSLELRWNPVAELTPRQLAKATTEPDLLWVLAQHVADSWERAVGRRPAVRASAMAALLPYREQALVISTRDLAAEDLPLLRHADWIRPLDRSPALR